MVDQHMGELNNPSNPRCNSSCRGHGFDMLWCVCYTFSSVDAGDFFRR